MSIVFSFVVVSLYIIKSVGGGHDNSIRFLRRSLRWKQLNFSLTIKISLCWNIFTLLVVIARVVVRRSLLLLLAMWWWWW
jgi:hypothetical protein